MKTSAKESALLCELFSKITEIAEERVIAYVFKYIYFTGIKSLDSQIKSFFSLFVIFLCLCVCMSVHLFLLV